MRMAVSASAVASHCPSGEKATASDPANFGVNSINIRPTLRSQNWAGWSAGATTKKLLSGEMASVLILAPAENSAFNFPEGMLQIRTKPRSPPATSSEPSFENQTPAMGWSLRSKVCFSSAAGKFQRRTRPSLQAPAMKSPLGEIAVNRTFASSDKGIVFSSLRDWAKREAARKTTARTLNTEGTEGHRGRFAITASPAQVRIGLRPEPLWDRR